MLFIAEYVLRLISSDLGYSKVVACYSCVICISNADLFLHFMCVVSIPFWESQLCFDVVFTGLGLHLNGCHHAQISNVSTQIKLKRTGMRLSLCHVRCLKRGFLNRSLLLSIAALLDRYHSSASILVLVFLSRKLYYDEQTGEF